MILNRCARASRISDLESINATDIRFVEGILLVLHDIYACNAGTSPITQQSCLVLVRPRNFILVHAGRIFGDTSKVVSPRRYLQEVISKEVSLRLSQDIVSAAVGGLRTDFPRFTILGALRSWRAEITRNISLKLLIWGVRIVGQIVGKAFGDFRCWHFSDVTTGRRMSAVGGRAEVAIASLDFRV